MEETPIALFVASVLFFYFFLSTAMAEEIAKPSAAAPVEEGEATVHIVYVERPEGMEPRAFHVQTLSAVLGSEEAAKDAVIHQYTHAATGFSAKLTAKQVEALRKQPGVLQVLADRTYHLHGSHAVGRMGAV